MNLALKKYLSRHASLEVRPLELLSGKLDAIEMAVVVPVLAEHPGLFGTLDDLANNTLAWGEKTLLVLVVNNRAPGIAACGDIENNLACIKALREFAEGGNGTIGLIDAASPGNEIAKEEGVGHARKMGMDWAVKLLGQRDRMDAPVICLDADTRVPPDYLVALKKFFAEKARWGVVVDYAHPLESGAPECPAILAYELYLRYSELGLHYVCSPFAYPAIGSAMACSVRAYIAAGGMKRRAAAEDFYFLEALAKTGCVEHCWDTRVQPSARVSHRAPIGTGKHVGEYLAGQGNPYEVCHPHAYTILRNFFVNAKEALQQKNVPPLENFQPAELRDFHAACGFSEAWEKIAKHTQDPEQRIRHFNVNYDALRTLRALHHLRDTSTGTLDMLEDIQMLFRMHQASPLTVDTKDWRQNFTAQAHLLETMRKLTREIVEGGKPTH